MVGINHHTAPVEVRERLDLSNGQLESLLDGLLAIAGVDEVVALSTCNRVEVVVCHASSCDPTEDLAASLLGSGGLDADRYRASLFELSGREAIRHVFRVAASLDSMIVGEPQILGQMKEQFALSANADAAGPILHRVFEKSFTVAKRIRSETGIASRAVSVASAAVDLAGKIFESLRGRSVMLVGTGEIGEMTARHFSATGMGRLMVSNRTFEGAVELARNLGGTPVPFERFPMYLPLADLVIGSAGGGVLLDAETVEEALLERKGSPVFFIDLAVPRNFDAAINDIENAYLYDIDDLTAVVEENLGERRRDAIEGEAIVEEEVDGFWSWLEKLELAPTIVELRELAEDIRQQEVERSLRHMPTLGTAERENLELMSRAIVNKLLHTPTSVLKEESDEAALVSAVRRLFRLGKRR